MHLLQPQPEVTTSSLISTHLTRYFALPDDMVQLSPWQNLQTEHDQVEWLILHFNHWFSHQNVNLIKGDSEPEYFPASKDQPAKIQFAHGFFNSALHEISHWCIAGQQRRLLADLGYWYAPDGRNQEQQQQFEQVEVKPQAIEWLFSKAFGFKFRVSLDNLTGNAGHGIEFKDRVFEQVQRFFVGQTKLPRDATIFIGYICACTRQGRMLEQDEFRREDLD